MIYCLENEGTGARRVHIGDIRAFEKRSNSPVNQHGIAMPCMWTKGKNVKFSVGAPIASNVRTWTKVFHVLENKWRGNLGKRCNFVLFVECGLQKMHSQPSGSWHCADASGGRGGGQESGGHCSSFLGGGGFRGGVGGLSAPKLEQKKMRWTRYLNYVQWWAEPPWKVCY